MAGCRALQVANAAQWLEYRKSRRDDFGKTIDLDKGRFMRNDGLDRREFVKTAAAVGATTTFLPLSPGLGWSSVGKKVRFGVIADVHKDIMHDADRRLQIFMDRVIKEQVDFIIQMGDFCIPIPENKPFLDIWNTFTGPRHHVLGNHDMDGDGRHRPSKAYAFKRTEAVEYWGMKSPYYSFDLGGVHCIVLDGNDKPAKAARGYRRYISKEQANWLAKDLAKTEQPTLIFVHQSIEREGGVQNQQEIRKILEQARHGDGSHKVIACFSGHHHRDYVRRINGILYPQINSASYHWVGGQFQHLRYGKDIDKRYPSIKYTVPYKDPLYAIVTIDPERGYLQIDGTKSEFVGPPPWELGKTRKEWEANSLVPSISDWKIPF